MLFTNYHWPHCRAKRSIATGGSRKVRAYVSENDTRVDEPTAGRGDSRFTRVRSPPHTRRGVDHANEISCWMGGVLIDRVSDRPMVFGAVRVRLLEIGEAASNIPL